MEYNHSDLFDTASNRADRPYDSGRDSIEAPYGLHFADLDKPSDMADDTVMSGDGVNPVAKNDEDPRATDSYEDGFNITFPGAVPPAYFPGFPGGPSIG